LDIAHLLPHQSLTVGHIQRIKNNKDVNFLKSGNIINPKLVFAVHLWFGGDSLKYANISDDMVETVAENFDMYMFYLGKVIENSGTRN
jgi:hypothetical protein